MSPSGSIILRSAASCSAGGRPASAESGQNSNVKSRSSSAAVTSSAVSSSSSSATRSSASASIGSWSTSGNSATSSAINARASRCERSIRIRPRCCSRHRSRSQDATRHSAANCTLCSDPISVRATVCALPTPPRKFISFLPIIARCAEPTAFSTLCRSSASSVPIVYRACAWETWSCTRSRCSRRSCCRRRLWPYVVGGAGVGRVAVLFVFDGGRRVSCASIAARHAARTAASSASIGSPPRTQATAVRAATSAT